MAAVSTATAAVVNVGGVTPVTAAGVGGATPTAMRGGGRTSRGAAARLRQKLPLVILFPIPRESSIDASRQRVPRS